MSLRFKLLFPLLVLNVVLAGYLYYFWLPQTEAIFMEEHNRELNGHLESVSEIITPHLLDKDISQLQSHFDVLLEKNHSWSELVLLDGEGRQLYPIGRQVDTNILELPDLMVINRDLAYFGRTLGYLSLISDLREEKAVVYEHGMAVITALMVIVFAVVVLIGLLFDYWIHRPLLVVVRAANALSKGEFDVKLPQAKNNEVGALVSSFRVMCDAIYQSQTKLEEKSSRIAEILESTTDAYLAMDNHFAVTYINSRAKSLLGVMECPESVAIQQCIPRFDHYFFDKVKESVTTHTMQIYTLYYDETEKWLEVHIHPTAEGVALYFRDMSEKRKREDRLLLAESVFNGSGEGIVITDHGGRILRVNAAFSAITGYSEEEMIGNRPSVLSSGKHDQGFFDEMWKTIDEKGGWRGEIWNRKKNGDVYLEWLDINSVKNDEGEVTYYVGVFTDITEKKYTEDRIYHLAHHDSLTGLANRTLLNDRIEQAILSSQRGKHDMAIIYMDVDRFKHINDTLGHQVGDALLQEIARRLKSVLRESDTVSRFGGDEFVILLSMLDDHLDAGEVAQKLARVLAKPYDLVDHELYVTTSMGIALYPQDGENRDDLLKNADTALYHAKDLGRNNFQFYTADLNASSLKRLTMENALRKALSNDEFSLYYQPQVDFSTGMITGAEALIRWNNSDLGMISPAEFIPLLEDTGMIVEVGEWVLNTACKKNKEWVDRIGHPLRMAVNLSPVQFKKSDLHGTIENALKSTGLDPAMLELEITEGCIMQDADENIAVLNQLKDLGVELAVDDFGTGYSSLSYLKRFPIDVLKIDQSFVRDITTDADDAAIVMSIITLGHSLGLSVIAEGVESHEQLVFLNNSDCDSLQGYYVAKPMPEDEFSRFLEENYSAPVLSIVNQ